MILVTGGAGFIGSNLVAALNDRGDAVAVCDRLGQSEKWRNLAKREVMDIVPPESCLDWLDRHKSAVRGVVHLGAITDTTARDADAIIKANLHASVALWEWCAAHRRFLLYASSAATYGSGAAGFEDGSDPAALAGLRPLNLYGWSKHLFDRRVARVVVSGGPVPSKWAGLKFFNVYGPNEYHKAAMQSLVAKNHASVAAGKKMPLFRSSDPDFPDGGQERDFVYVRDCVAVLLWLIDNEAPNDIYNLGTGKARSFLDLAHALLRAVGRKPAVEAIDFIDMPEALRGAYQNHTEARIDRLRRAGYEDAFATLEEGVADYVERFLARDDPYR
ncbi:MAG: ADP-glyceromanno-heptose 6-epimerase [Dongiaceae bacterium]